METETLFVAALQSSFLLGLIHGVNPCGHSWLVLAPFVTGEKRGGRVAVLTVSFLGGTAIACLLLGATLGTISSFVPPVASYWLDLVTSGVLLVLGVALIYNPELLHSHSHDHHHDHHHEKDGSCHTLHQSEGLHMKCGHGHNHDSHDTTSLRNRKKWLAVTLFGIGFVNMIIPCPTAAIMYGYALNSGSISTATAVFGSYAISTAIAVGLVIYLIFKVTSMASRLQKDWVEPLIMRIAGVIIVVFSGYGVYAALYTS